MPLRPHRLSVGWGVDMGLDGQVQPSLAQDEFAERLRRVWEAQELRTGYAVQVRDVALAAWVLAVVVLVGLWLGVLLLSDAVPTVPTLRDVDVAPFLPRPTGGV